MKKLFLFVLYCIFSSTILGQSIGDYQSAASGNWNNASTWYYYDGSSWVSSSDYPTDLNRTITIQSGHTVTNISTNLSGTGTLNVDGTLNVTGRYIIDYYTTISGSLTTTNYINTVITFTVYSAGFFTTSYVSTYGWWSGSNAPSSIIANGTIIFNGANNQKIPSATYFNIYIYGSGNKYLTGDVSISSGGLLTISNGTNPTTLNLNGNTLTLSGSSSIQNDVYGTLSSSAGTILFNGTSQSINGTGVYNLPNLTVSSITATSLNSDIYVFNLLTVLNSGSFSLNGHTVYLRGAGLTLNGTLNADYGNLYFDEGTQKIDGTGSVNGTFYEIGFGMFAGTSNTTFSFSNVINTDNLTISDGTLTLAPTAKVVVNAYVNVNTNNGLVLQSDAFSISSLMLAPGSYTNDVNSEVDYYLTGNSNGTMWHYISPSVASVDTSDLSSLGIKNVIRYDESFITTDADNGWVSYGGYHYNTSTSQWEKSLADRWNPMVAGMGYNYYYSSPYILKIFGLLNTDDTPVTLHYGTGGSGTPSQQGFNLIGNPFTCGLNWDAVVGDGSNTGILNSYGHSIYYRKNGVSYVYSNSITVPDDYQDGRFVAPGQGFFVQATSDNITLNIPSAAKVQTSNLRFKSGTIVPNIRLQIDGSGQSDQTVVRFDNNATNGFDVFFDAFKLFPSSSSPGISTSLNGLEFTINGIPFPEKSVSIPAVVRIPASGTYSIWPKVIEGMDNYKITLTDTYQNFSIDLAGKSSYSFTSSSGKYTDRFILKVENITTDIIPDKSKDNSFNLFSANGMLNIQLVDDSWNNLTGEIRVIDLTGRMLMYSRNNEFVSGEIKQVPMNLNNGVYIVEISTPLKKFTGKVIFK